MPNRDIVRAKSSGPWSIQRGWPDAGGGADRSRDQSQCTAPGRWPPRYSGRASTSNVKRQSTTRTCGSRSFAAVCSVDQKRSGRVKGLTVSDSSRSRPRDEEDRMNARRSMRLIVTLLLLVATIALGARPADAKKIAAPPSASFWRFGLAVGTHNGTAAGPAGLTLSGTLAPGVYTDIYGTGAPRDIAYHSGEWLSEAFTAPFDFDELVASWNATTPDGTWIK